MSFEIHGCLARSAHPQPLMGSCRLNRQLGVDARSRPPAPGPFARPSGFAAAAPVLLPGLQVPRCVCSGPEAPHGHLLGETQIGGLIATTHLEVRGNGPAASGVGWAMGLG